MTKEECEIETSKAIMEMRSCIAELEKEKFELLGVIQGKDKVVQELKEKISILLSCKNCPENKGGWICAREYENKCLPQKIVYIKELKKEKRKLLGIIRDKDKVIQELEKEKEAEAYAIENWEYYEEGKNDSKALKRAYRQGAEFGYNKAFVEADKNLKAIVTDFNKARELIEELSSSLSVVGECEEEECELLNRAEQFLRKSE